MQYVRGYWRSCLSSVVAAAAVQVQMTKRGSLCHRCGQPAT